MKGVETKTLKLNKNQIKKVMEGSGYLLEQRICPKIETRGFFVEPNPQYQDQDTGKSREIDVYAMDIRSLYRNEFNDSLSIILLIECKTNSTPVVFFTHGSPIPEGLFGFIEMSGSPQEIHNSKLGYEVPIEDYLHFGSFHHNFKLKWIAKQFCQLKPKAINKNSPKKKKFEWSATHEDLYGSIESLVKAVEYYKNEEKDLNSYTKDKIRLSTIYPILLFSGKIYECRMFKKKYEIKDSQHIILHKSVASKSMKGNYQIDVIQESFLDNFLKMINEETEIVVRKLKRNRKVLKTNVEREYKKQLRIKR